MATFSQFKSKYITERRSKNIGDEGTKNIVKKLLGKDAIPDDGGKSGQSRIERELGLNKPNKSSTPNRFFTDKPDSETLKAKPTADQGQFKQNPKFASGATGTTPSGSPEMGGESKKFVKNRRTPLKTKVIQPNTNPVRKPFEPSFKIKGTTKTTTPPSKPTFTKTNNPSFKDFGKKVNNVKSKKPVSFDITTNKGNVVTQSKSSAVPSRGIKTDFLDLVNKPKTNPVSKFIRKGLEVQGIVDPKPNTKAFTRTTDTITTNVGKAVKPSKLGRFVRGVSGRLIAPAFAVKDYLDTTAKTQAQGYSKNYSRAKGLTKALSGYIGGGIGATVGGAVGLGIPGSIAGGVTGYHYGQKLGDKAFDYTQKFVSGKKTFKDLRKDVDSGLKKLNLKNKQY